MYLSHIEQHPALPPEWLITACKPAKFMRGAIRRWCACKHSWSKRWNQCTMCGGTGLRVACVEMQEPRMFHVHAWRGARSNADALAQSSAAGCVEGRRSKVHRVTCGASRRLVRCMSHHGTVLPALCSSPAPWAASTCDGLMRSHGRSAGRPAAACNKACQRTVTSGHRRHLRRPRSAGRGPAGQRRERISLQVPVHLPHTAGP